MYTAFLPVYLPAVLNKRIEKYECYDFERFNTEWIFMNFPAKIQIYVKSKTLKFSHCVYLVRQSTLIVKITVTLVQTLPFKW